jgi:hypothetical protein
LSDFNRFGLPLLGQVVGEDRNKRYRQSAFRCQTPQKIGNSKSDEVRIRGALRAKEKPDHNIAKQPRDSAEQGKEAYDSGGPG